MSEWRVVRYGSEHCQRSHESDAGSSYDGRWVDRPCSTTGSRTRVTYSATEIKDPPHTAGVDPGMCRRAGLHSGHGDTSGSRGAPQGSGQWLTHGRGAGADPGFGTQAKTHEQRTEADPGQGNCQDPCAQWSQRWIQGRVQGRTAGLDLWPADSG